MFQENFKRYSDILSALPDDTPLLPIANLFYNECKKKTPEIIDQFLDQQRINTDKMGEMDNKITDADELKKKWKIDIKISKDSMIGIIKTVGITIQNKSDNRLLDGFLYIIGKS